MKKAIVILFAVLSLIAVEKQSITECWGGQCVQLKEVLP